jgi:hypothetical protein
MRICSRIGRSRGGNKTTGRIRTSRGRIRVRRQLEDAGEIRALEMGIESEGAIGRRLGRPFNDSVLIVRRSTADRPARAR